MWIVERMRYRQTNRPTNQPTNRRTDNASYRDARTHLKTVRFKYVFTRDEATIRACIRPSLGWSVGPSVTLSLFGLLESTYDVYTALLSLKNKAVYSVNTAQSDTTRWEKTDYAGTDERMGQPTE